MNRPAIIEFILDLPDSCCCRCWVCRVCTRSANGRMNWNIRLRCLLSPSGKANPSNFRAMNLPNYFLADLPREAPLSAAMITDACQSLKANRERYLAERSTQNMIRTLSDLAQE